MSDKLNEISKWLIEQGQNVTREVLEEKLQEAYSQGRFDSFQEQIDKTIDNIHYNTVRKIRQDKNKLYEDNFYDKPSQDVVIKMKALEYLEEHIGEFISQYKES